MFETQITICRRVASYFLFSVLSVSEPLLQTHASCVNTTVSATKLANKCFVCIKKNIPVTGQMLGLADVSPFKIVTVAMKFIKCALCSYFIGTATND